MATYVLGKDGKLYFGVAGTTAATEMGNVRDVTLTMEAGSADVTTRANFGWRATAPTLRECTCEFDMLWDPDDQGFKAIKNAFLVSALIALTILDKANGQCGMLVQRRRRWRDVFLRDRNRHLRHATAAGTLHGLPRKTVGHF